MNRLEILLLVLGMLSLGPVSHGSAQDVADAGVDAGPTSDGASWGMELVRFFRRGLAYPRSIPEEERSRLSARVQIVVREDGRIESLVLVQGSGNADFDAVVRRRIDEILASGERLPPPPVADRGRYVDRPITLHVVPPRR